MEPFWQDIIHPLLQHLAPTSLIEIGCERGKTTGQLLEFCERHGAVLHGIDPAPRFDVDEWTARHKQRLIFHRTTSLEALPRIDHVDCVLIDGDHNWYTVFHELDLLFRRSSETQFPVVILHDVAWPYGRRDLYYDPATIPEEYRHPFAKLGIDPATGMLTRGGWNSGLHHAIHEGGPRNGVLTAIEDFLGKHSAALKFVLIPSFHGLGILFPKSIEGSHPALARFLESWTLAEELNLSLMRLERARVRLRVGESRPVAADRDRNVVEQILGIAERGDLTADVKLSRLSRLLAKHRSEKVKDLILAEHGQTVQSGPFQGMQLLDRVAEGCYVPKLLGCYEQELHRLVEGFPSADYECVIVIGCAEGYYAVGLARLLPDVEVYAYDGDETAGTLCRKLAEINDVSERVHVKGLFSIQEFSEFSGKRCLVICDVEGAELEVLNPARAPALAEFDILVELHEFQDARISEKLLARFAASHEPLLVDHASRDHTQFSALDKLSSYDQLIALWEWREGPTPWAMLRSRRAVAT